MMKRTQLILLFMLVLSGAVLLGAIPAGAQGTGTTNITGVTIDKGVIVAADITGMVSPCVNDPARPDLGCQQMYYVEELWYCNGAPTTPPTPENPQNCRQFNYSTLGAAYNRWVFQNGGWKWILP